MTQKDTYEMSHCVFLLVFFFHQSLIMVYAHLMHSQSQISAVLEFLYSVPGPTGKPALEFVLVEWVSRHVIFYGAYDSKVR